MFIGTLGAIQQNKIKRLFAYSSIAHVGYLLISLATGTIESIEALLIYAVLYTLTIINVFSIILIMSGFSAGEYANEIVGENEREGVHGRVRARKNFGTV
jgi:NADH-quinone oxidoreductase subunit N